MTEYTELKRLAEDAIDDSRCRHDFQMEVTPKVVLGLIAEIDRLNDIHNRLKKMVDDGSIQGRTYSAGLDQEKEIDKLRTQNQALLKELNYIAGISNGQVKRVADQALASLAEGGV